MGQVEEEKKIQKHNKIVQACLCEKRQDYPCQEYPEHKTN